MSAIKQLFHVNAPIEKVFIALTTIEGLSNWWTKNTEGKCSIGENITFNFGDGRFHQMRVIESKPSELIRWECINSNDQDWIGTKVSFRLDIANNKTRVRFEHSNWLHTEDLFAACSFSWGRYMESIRQYCQTGIGEPFGSPNFRK